MTSKSADTIERRGHCLCGKVSITATNASSDVGACHCKMCRCWGGGPFMIDEKPGYYEFANKTKDFTGAELFAMFGSS